MSGWRLAEVLLYILITNKMNKQIPLLIALLGLWIAGSAFFRYNAGCCQTTETVNSAIIGATAPVVAPPLEPVAAEPSIAESTIVEEEVVPPVTETNSADVDDNQLTIIANRLKNSSLTLYFDRDAKISALSTDQQQFLDDLVIYLANEPTAIVKSIGHTDNQGEYVRNKYISRKRAEFVRDYLVQNGISEKQIWVFYEGPDEPIADNETREGRAKNRRVEVILK